ncbi:MAG: sigma-70 family RNA polymerase sigma factor [Planctomycetaceae bacterium]|nr:sigma-70 family RNA polymerase sigma factor [Planctomycetaceae bacterium]
MKALIDQKVYECSGQAYHAMSDEELLMAYRTEEDRVAFEELVKRYERELYNYLRHYLGNAELAEDVFQTTFFLIHQKRGLYEEGRAFRPWLYRIATNQAIDAKRRNKRHSAISLDAQTLYDENSQNLYAAQLAGDETDPGETMLDMERGHQVRDAVEQLPETLRQVLYLVYFQGLKYREAAETLGIPFGTIKSRLNCAIKKLQLVLAKAV